MRRILLFASLLVGCAFQSIAQQKENILAPTPPMGWNSWNIFQTNINEPLLKQMVDAYISSGMRDAGYTYFVLDDAWMSMERDQNGQLVADPKKFPNGMKEFADYVHSKGLKFGIYNCAGTKTCAGYPGTHGHEYEDARLYASWGVDYLKFDWCNAEGIEAKEAYKTMSLALKATGRPIVFSLCEWGTHRPWLWAAEDGQLWRTTGDIGPYFNKAEANKDGWRPLSVLDILDRQDSIRQYAGPGHWNDPDMLEVGNGMKFSEDKAHFSLWCMLAAPLMAGNNLEKMSPEITAILTNKDAIAIDQDPLGVGAFRYYQFDGVEIWVRPLANGDIAVCFLNRSDRTQTVTFDWTAHLIKDKISKMDVDFNQTTYKLKDIWSKQDLGTTKKLFKQPIPSNDVIVLRLIKS